MRSRPTARIPSAASCARCARLPSAAGASQASAAVRALARDAAAAHVGCAPDELRFASVGRAPRLERAGARSRPRSLARPSRTLPRRSRRDGARERREVNVFKPIHRLAIVNRGEAAMRCIRTVKALRALEGSELQVIALYTDPDRDAPFVRHADGRRAPADRRAARSPPTSITTRVLAPLRRDGADAVWPGWGFVAEDPQLRRSLDEAGIRFLGPSAETMRRLGDKIAAKLIAEPRRRSGLAVERRRGRERGAGRRARGAHRLSAGHQGLGGRRRPRHPRRRAPRTSSRPPSPRPRSEARDGLRRRPPLHRRRMVRAAATSRCRSSPTGTAWCSRSAAATARCSAGTRRSSKRRRRRGFRARAARASSSRRRDRARARGRLLGRRHRRVPRLATRASSSSR